MANDLIVLEQFLQLHVRASEMVNRDRGIQQDHSAAGRRAASLRTSRVSASRSRLLLNTGVVLRLLGPFVVQSKVVRIRPAMCTL